MSKIIIICGATASGKSQLALDLAQKYLKNSVIINADAMQIYAKIPILTAQPSLAEQKIIPHKLYGFLAADKKYSVYEWLDDVVKEINEALNNNLTPILVGGTGMYIKSLISGIREINPISEKTINITKEIIAEQGVNYLYEFLYNIDPKIKLYVSKTDSHRLIRYYNLYQEFNISPSEYRNFPNKQFFAANMFKLFCLLPLREKNYRKCDDRVLEMFKMGVLTEIKNLIGKYDINHPIAKILGYKEIYYYLTNDKKNQESLQNTINKIQQLTRNYAKKQHTWFNNQLDINDIIAQDKTELMIKIKQALNL